MQAAQYDVPQDRRRSFSLPENVAHFEVIPLAVSVFRVKAISVFRVFILAAAPGEVLPSWPLPTTTAPPALFSGPQHAVNLKINGKLVSILVCSLSLVHSLSFKLLSLVLLGPVFRENIWSRSAVRDLLQYDNQVWTSEPHSLSAPYRGKTVFNAIGDLPAKLDTENDDKVSKVSCIKYFSCECQACSISFRFY